MDRLHQAAVRAHTLQFLFLFQAPQSYAGSVQGSHFRARLDRKSSMWERLVPGLLQGEANTSRLRRWEERTERLLPEVRWYLYRFTASEGPTVLDDKQGFQPAVEVYTLKRAATEALGQNKCLGRDFRFVLHEPRFDPPIIELQLQLEARLYLFELGQVALRLRVKVKDADLSVLSALRLVEALGVLDPTSHSWQSGRFWAPPDSPDKDSAQQVQSKQEELAGLQGEERITRQYQEWGRSFRTLALLNCLLRDLTATGREYDPGRGVDLAKDLCHLDQQVLASLGPGRSRAAGPRSLPLSEMGAEFRDQAGFPTWFNLDRAHRYVYLDYDGSAVSLADQYKVLSWASSGHSLAYLGRTPPTLPAPTLTVLPGDCCVANPLGFLGLRGSPKEENTDTDGAEVVAEQLFSYFLLAAHQRQYILGLSLLCAHETSRYETGSGAPGAEAGQLEALTGRLTELRYLSLQFQVKAMFSEASIHPTLQSAYEGFQEGFNVAQAGRELQEQLREMQTFLEVRWTQLQSKRERARAISFTSFQWVGATLAALTVPFAMATGVFGGQDSLYPLRLGFLGCALALVVVVIRGLPPVVRHFLEKHPDPARESQVCGAARGKLEETRESQSSPEHRA